MKMKICIELPMRYRECSPKEEVFNYESLHLKKIRDISRTYSNNLPHGFSKRINKLLVLWKDEVCKPLYPN
jgi:hypothetical protein